MATMSQTKEFTEYASEQPDVAAGGSQMKESRRLHSSHSSGMESSIFRIQDLTFVIPSKKKNQEDNVILRDINGSIKWGRE